MKLLLSFLFFGALFASPSLLSQETKWNQNLETAFSESKKSKKPILLYFTGSDWCAPCKSLKKNILETQKFKDLASQMVLVEIDWPRRIDLYTEEQLAYNKKIIQKLNAERSFPKLMFLDSKGHVVDELKGYSASGQDALYFRFFNKNLGRNKY